MSDGPRLTALGKIFIFLFVLLCGAGAYYFFTRDNRANTKGRGSSSSGGVFDSITGGGELGTLVGAQETSWA